MAKGVLQAIVIGHEHGLHGQGQSEDIDVNVRKSSQVA